MKNKLLLKFKDQNSILLFKFFFVVFFFLQTRVSRPLQVSDYFLRCMQSLPLHTLGYYKKEFHKGGPKTLARGFKPKISWISQGLKNH